MYSEMFGRFRVGITISVSSLCVIEWRSVGVYAVGRGGGGRICEEKDGIGCVFSFGIWCWFAIGSGTEY